jgi:hypothetical protein
LSKWRKKRRTHCQLGHLSGRGQNFLFWGNKSRERGKRGRIASWAICQEEAKLPFWGGGIKLGGSWPRPIQFQFDHRYARID